MILLGNVFNKTYSDFAQYVAAVQMYLSQTFVSSLGWGERANLDKLLPLRFKQIPKTDYWSGIYELVMQFFGKASLAFKYINRWKIAIVI